MNREHKTREWEMDCGVFYLVFWECIREAMEGNGIYSFTIISFTFCLFFLSRD